MHVTELHSFISKFHQLWEAGVTAHLDLDTHAGQAWVGLRVQLGQSPGPGYQHEHRRFVQPTPPRSPAYYRRQERRKAAQIVEADTVSAVPVVEPSADQASGNGNLGEKSAVKAVCEKEVVEVEKKVPVVEPSADQANGNDNSCEKPAVKAVNENEVVEFEKKVEKHEQIKNLEVPEEYYCEICDFRTNWRNSLNIHISRKHSKIEQLDGLNDIKDDEEYDKNSKYYWKNGKISSVYQTFLDVNRVIEESDLIEHEKEIEKHKVLEARKEAFGESLYKYYPPWDRK